MIIDSKGKILGGLLKRIGDLDMDNFEGRLTLQKKIYLLEEFGINLGYNFSWYLHGPYSPELTKTGYKLKSEYGRLPHIKFVDKRLEDNFDAFKKFIWLYKDDSKMLELLASILFLKKRAMLEKPKILEIILKKDTCFKEEEFEKAWQYLVEKKMM